MEKTLNNGLKKKVLSKIFKGNLKLIKKNRKTSNVIKYFVKIPNNKLYYVTLIPLKLLFV